MIDIQWHSNDSKAKFTFYAQKDSIKQIDSDIVFAIKESLFEKSNGKWGQSGRRYLYDRDGNIYGGVFSSSSE